MHQKEHELKAIYIKGALVLTKDTSRLNSKVEMLPMCSLCIRDRCTLLEVA